MAILTTWDAKEAVQISDSGIVTVTAEEYTYDSWDKDTDVFINKVLTGRACSAKLNKGHPSFNTKMRMLLKEAIGIYTAEDVAKQGVNTEMLKVSYAGLQNYKIPEA